MKSDKHEAKKLEILESAFHIWGKDRFCTRSLADLAAAHNITKQALYRYFSSKDKLEAAMEQRAMSVYTDHAATHLEVLKETAGDAFVDVYVDGSLNFIRKNALYLAYLSYRYRNDEDQFLSKKFLDDVTVLAQEKAGIPEVAVRYLNALVILDSHRKKGGDCERLKTIWQDGFGTGKVSKEPDFDRLLNDAMRIDLDRFQEDPLMLAVFEAVMEEGGAEVSLGKVARKAGLTKSSLYNYWPSKEAMLTDVLGRQMAIYTDMFEEFSGKYTEPADKIFAYMAFTGSFFRRTPEILNYMQRLMSFGTEIKASRSPSESRFTQLLDSILEEGYIRTGIYEPLEILGITNMAAVMEIKHHLTEGSVRIRIEQSLKDLYRLLVGGISALRRTM